MSRLAGGGIRYFDSLGRSGRSGSRRSQPSILASTSLGPGPAVRTRASPSREPAEVDVELRKAGAEPIAGEGFRLKVQALEDLVALLGVGLRESGRHARFGEVQAAAFDQEGLAGLTLEIEPELAGLKGQPGVFRVEIVVADRPRGAERGRARITRPPLGQNQDACPTPAGEVGGEEAHDPSADDGQVVDDLSQDPWDPARLGQSRPAQLASLPDARVQYRG